MALTPYHQTVTERKGVRRDIRYWLGTSREDPPTTPALMCAVARMSELVRLTTGGRVSLILMDNRTNGCVSPQAVREAEDHLPIEQAGGIVLSKADREALDDLLDCVPLGKLQASQHLVKRITEGLS